MRPTLAALAAPLAAAIATVAAAQDRQSPVEVQTAAFGVLAETAPGAPPAFQPTETVNMADHPNYGWVIQLRTARRTVHWRERLTLPSPPESWPDGLDVSPDRRSVTLERDVEPVGGVIYNFWSVADGDPKGRYLITVSVEGGPERRFEFDVR